MAHPLSLLGGGKKKSIKRGKEKSLFLLLRRPGSVLRGRKKAPAPRSSFLPHPSVGEKKSLRAGTNKKGEGRPTFPCFSSEKKKGAGGPNEERGGKERISTHQEKKRRRGGKMPQWEKGGEKKKKKVGVLHFLLYHVGKGKKGGGCRGKRERRKKKKRGNA